MLTRFFDRITRASVTWRWLTIILTFAVLAIGGYSYTQINQELVPPVEFPQTILVAQWSDAESTDNFLTDVTIPLELAMQGIEGVVNVESTTNKTLGIFIVRNEFGENQARLTEDIKTAAAETPLPEGVEPEVFNFNLSDLPVVIASVSSAELTLPELKTLIETELEPQLADIEFVSQVNISGGQELPEEVEESEQLGESEQLTVNSETVGEVEEVGETEASDPNRLSPILVAGLAVYGIEVEFADEIPPTGARGLIYEGGMLSMQALELLTPDNLRMGLPETLAYLPSDYVETLDVELVDELNEISAEFGGIGQFSIAEALEARDAGLDVLTGLPVEDGTIADFPPGEESEQLTVNSEAVEEVGEVGEVGESVDDEANANVIKSVDLPEMWVQGAQAQGMEIATTADLTPEFMEQLISFAPESLALLTPEMLLATPLDVIAVLPIDYLAELDAETQAALQERVSMADGEMVSADSHQAEITPVDLPDAWISAAASQDIEIATTEDLTPELVEGIAQVAPQMLTMLTPEMLLAMPLDALAVLPTDFLAELDADTQTALQAHVGMATDEQEQAVTPAPIEPIELPDTWIGAASIQGLTVETTADVTPELVESIATSAPQLLADLTSDMLLVLPLNVFPALPPSYLAQLDADTQSALQARVANSETQQTALPLPDDWITIAASRGIEIATTDDLTADLLTGVAIFAPSRLNQLTNDMLLSAPSEALLGLPERYVATLDNSIQAAVAAATMVAVESEIASGSTDLTAETNDGAVAPVALPEEWVALAAQQNLVLETTADLTPQIVTGIAQFAPQALEALTPEMLLALSPDVVAALPSEYITTLDADLVAELGFGVEAIESEANVEAIEETGPDPAELSPIFTTVGEQVGAELTTVDDITPDFIRQVGAFGEQGMQLLGLLTPDNLRLLDPEAVALLPAEFLDTIDDDDLHVYLDGRAVEFGGAGQLLVAEAEAAAALAEGAPALSGIWLEPNPEGEPSQFQNAADILNNPFAPGGAALLNFFPNSPNVDDPLDWMSELNLEVITFMAENEEGFADNLQANIVEMLPPESINYLLDTYPGAYDEVTATRLRDVAAGDVEVFIPEATVTRSNGDPSLLILVYKNGDANTVKTFKEVEVIMEEFSAEHPIDYLYAFEQSTFIEESIAGVTREGALGALFAVIVILIFLSGRIDGKYRLSWRATLITGLSIPASVLFAMLLMWLVPRTIGPWITDLALDSNNILLVSIAKLFPAKLTLNIMTLSGLTVAIGRVVDDSIVVLENSYRYIQKGEHPVQAVYRGTREVAVAIFSATVTTMAVFLPIGFVGGLISEFFLPFGLTVTYALAASYIVSITVVPALTVLLIRRENIPEERETAMQRGYTPILEWALNNRLLTLGIATLIFISSIFLISRLPNSFIPALASRP